MWTEWIRNRLIISSGAFFFSNKFISKNCILSSSAWDSVKNGLRKICDSSTKALSSVQLFRISKPIGLVRNLKHRWSCHSVWMESYANEIKNSQMNAFYLHFDFFFNKCIYYIYYLILLSLKAIVGKQIQSNRCTSLNAMRKHGSDAEWYGITNQIK